MGERENAKRIWDFLTSNGWTTEATAGVLGNMETESHFVADQWESNDVGNMNAGYGLVQWTPATKLINWANSVGMDYHLMDTQLQRILWEVENNVQFGHPTMSFKQFTQSNDSPESLAQIFLRYYEVPANMDQPNRSTQARYWYDQFQAGKDDSHVSEAIDAMISWMEERKGKVGYDMNDRFGPNNYDCSSAVYYSLIQGGFFRPGMMGNTDSLFGHLEQNGWTQVPVVNGEFDAKRGDIFIWGIRGNSGWDAGHTGIFIDSENIIECHYIAGYPGDGGIFVNNYNLRWTGQVTTVYRYSGNNAPKPNPDPNPSPNPGGLIPYHGVFYPNIELPISSDMDPYSPAVGYYSPGEAIIYDSYAFANGYAWIHYISYTGYHRYVAVGPDDGRVDTVWGTGFFDNGSGGSGYLTPYNGLFTADRRLAVSADLDPVSPEVAHYDAGMSFTFDSYVFANGYAWVSYISTSGSRRYVAVGPDDGRADTVWGTGFFDNGNGPDQNNPGPGQLTPKSGTFTADRRLAISNDTDPASPEVGSYDAGESFNYDSYIFTNGYAWVSYISVSGYRRYVAVGPADGDPNNTWGTGFFN